uniref:Small integral membrane protein 1 n=1 Tax=Fundulus heteroclitus TaxID=8078 RepID=A0A147AC36_FUNHE
MEPSGESSVRYDRWSENNINMNVEASQSTARRLYNRACAGRTGIVVKTTGLLAALAVIYIIGYVTGYYIHQCQ